MNDELYHYGILGMKWGVRRTLEELGHRRKAWKTKRKREKNLKKARKARVKAIKNKQKFEKNREKWSKDSTSMYAHKDAFSTEELNKAAERFGAEQRVHTLSVQRINKGKEYMQSLSGYLQTGLAIYDSASRIKKILYPDKEDTPKATRSMKEAQKVLKSIADTPLSDINLKDVQDSQARINAIRALETYADKNSNKKKN